jgi:putative phage-type endonuclease
MSRIEQFTSRPEWLAARRTGIGASDAAALFGVSPYHSRLSLYFEKRGLVEMGEAESEAMYWGRTLQEPIAARYAKETRRRIVLGGEFDLRRHEGEPFMIATLDAMAEIDTERQSQPAPGGGTGPGVVEIKNTGFFKREDWTDEPPLPFLIQANHQMYVEGTQWASVAALVGGNMFFYADLKRNDAFIEVLVKQCRTFWEDHVLAGKEPAPDASEATKRVLKALYPRDTGEAKALPAMYVDIDAELEKVKAEQKKLDSRRDELEAKLKLAIGAASIGIIGDSGVSYTYRTVEEAIVPSFTRKAYRTLRRREPK